MSRRVECGKKEERGNLERKKGDRLKTQENRGLFCGVVPPISGAESVKRRMSISTGLGMQFHTEQM